MANRPTSPDDEPLGGIGAPVPEPRDTATSDMFGGASTAPADAAKRPYVVLARKYRPQTFDDLIGQEAMVTTLRNAFASDRIAQGYMLTGVRGVGKTTTARILARALNYAKPGAPDRPTIDMPDLGVHCAQIIESRHPDVVEMDAASNTGIDNIREIIESARYKPIAARIKVFIIDEVHMLSKGAFNALLKTLEEPPGHVKFIFATTEVRKVPVTVLSRCQRFDLRRVDVPALAAHFKRIVAAEGARAADSALALIARAAEGSVRDGLSILDQAIAQSMGARDGAGEGSGEVGDGQVRAMLGLADRGRIFDLAECVFRGAAGEALAAFARLYHDGADAVQVLEDLAEAVHVAARVKIVGVDAAGEALSAEEKRRAKVLADGLSMALLSRAWQMLLKGIEEAGRAPSPAAAAEMVLIRLAHTADLPAPDEIIRALGGARGGTVSRPLGDGEAGKRSERPPLNSTTPDGPRADGARQPPAQPAAHQPPAGPDGEGNAPPRLEDGDPGWSPDGYGDQVDAADDGDPDEADPTEVPAATPLVLETFDAVVDLIGRKRDARLKIHIEENVSLVKFDPAGGIELHLLPRAPKEIANELREKLNLWTGRRWMVAVSRHPGAPPIGQVRREREAAELELLKAHPAVRAILQQFPDAEIKEVRPLRLGDDDTGTGTGG